jgi:hypothetical protein
MKAHQLRLPGKGKIEKPVIALHSTVSSHPEAIGKLRTEAACFAGNVARMRYPQFPRRRLFVWGATEAGFKTVIGSRLRQPGMFRTVRGANAIVALRCCRISRARWRSCSVRGANAIVAPGCRRISRARWRSCSAAAPMPSSR